MLAVASAALLLAAGCMSPPSSVARLNEKAYDMNVAARFGRLDVAMEHVAATSQRTYAEMHASWGKKLRVVDVDFGGVRKLANGDMVVEVVVQWQRFDESTLRVTSVAQTWRDSKGSWEVILEEPSGGDEGLFELPKNDEGAPQGSPSLNGLDAPARREPKKTLR
jgi:hypothetical protein